MLGTLDVSRVANGNTVLNLEQYLGLWAIEDQTFSAMWSMVLGMDLLAHVQGSTPKQAATSVPISGDGDGIVQLVIRGTMTKGGSSLSDAGSTVRLRQEIRKARRNPDVKGVLFVVESPGGTVAGTSELADEWYALSQEKPTVTLCEDLMASAGMYVGSQSRKVFANNEAAIVGSVGTYIGLYDYSGAAAAAGIRPVVIKTGDLKAAGFAGAEVTDEQKAMWQKIVNESQTGFVAALTRIRKPNAEQMAQISRAGVFSAKEAIGLGLIDGIRSYDAAVAELRSMIGGKKKEKRMSEQSESRQPASLSELEAACGGASNDFLVAQLKKGATVGEATRDYGCQLSATILEQKGQITALQGAIDSLKAEHATALADLKVTHAAELVKAQEAGAKNGGKPLSSGGSFPALKNQPGKPPVESGVSVKEQWNSRKAELVASGACRDLPAATMWLAKHESELHQAYVASLNA